jgi:hypothetical protein
LTESGFDMNKPLTRLPRTIVSYATVVQKESEKGVSQKSQSVGTTTTASTISGDSGTPWNAESIDYLKRKLAEIDTRRDTYAKQTKKSKTMSARSRNRCIRWHPILSTSGKT